MAKYVVFGKAKNPKLARALPSFLEDKKPDKIMPLITSHHVDSVSSAFKASGLEFGRTPYAREATKSIESAYGEKLARYSSKASEMKLRETIRLPGKYNFGLVIEAKEPRKVTKLLTGFPGVGEVKITSTPKAADVTAAIRDAKSRIGKDSRS